MSVSDAEQAVEMAEVEERLANLKARREQAAGVLCPERTYLAGCALAGMGIPVNLEPTEGGFPWEQAAANTAVRIADLTLQRLEVS